MTPEAIAALMRAWEREPTPRGEERWTAGGEGWRAWTGKGAEVEFCELVGALTAIIRPAVVIETGVGVGYTTRRIIPQLPAGGHLFGYESDPAFRAALQAVPAVAGDARVTIADQPSPDAATIADADLVILDSVTGRRLAEFDRWVSAGKPGSVLICHDASNRHRPDQVHTRIHAHLAASGVAGVFLPNPRGAWLGQHP